MAKTIELQIKKEHLIAMVKAFRKYKNLIEPIAIDQPEFNELIDMVTHIEGRIIVLNRIIHREYDGLDTPAYLVCFNKELEA